MKLESNLVAHYSAGTSDKVYMACIRCHVVNVVNNGLQQTKKYSVLGKWGRRGKKLSSQVKWTGDDLHDARIQQGELFRDKLSEGYADIDSASYRGPVTRNDREIAENMEAGIDGKSSVQNKPEKKTSLENERVLDPTTQVAVCVDNSGMEDRFDIGTSYVFELAKGRTERIKGMVKVYDKTGQADEYMAERFRFIKEE